MVLVYLPAVQHWAVDKASDWLSEEMGMEVSVASVRLRPPLDLEMGDVLAVQEGDTVLLAGSVDANVRLWPLLHGELEVDYVNMDHVQIDTRSMVADAQISGRMGHLELDAHSVRLREGVARLNHVLLQDADLHIALADSVPEDTTVSEPLAWVFMLDNIRLENARLRLMDSRAQQMADVQLDTVQMQGSVDLPNSVYNLQDLSVKASQIDYEDVHLTDVIFDSRQVRIDSLRLDVPEARLSTAETDLLLNFGMDLNAFDAEAPGQLVAKVSGHVGHNDLVAVGKPYAGDFMDGLPAKPLSLSFDVEGNLERLALRQANVEIPGSVVAEVDGVLCHLDGDADQMKVDANVKADLKNMDFVKGYLQQDVRRAFYLPHDMQLDASFNMDGGQLHTRSELLVATGCTRATTRHSIQLTGDMGMDHETYDLDMKVERLNVNQFVPLDQQIDLTGTVRAHGRGFDLMDNSTYIDAQMDFEQATFGNLDLSNIQGTLSLLNGYLQCEVDCDNDKLQTSALVSGKLQKEGIDVHLELDLPHADLKALGLIDDVLTVETRGIFDLSAPQPAKGQSWGNLFRINADVGHLDVTFGDNRINTNHLTIFAETQRDTTSATVSTGDLFFDFHAPYNVERLMAKTTKLGDVAARQLKDRALDPNALKQLLPRAQLHADVGRNNPVSEFLATRGITFNELRAHLETTPETGVLGDAHVYRLRTDSLILDTVYLDVRQDSAQFVYRTGVSCGDQKQFPGFTAHLDGYVSTTDGDARLTFFNLQRDCGIDMGLHGVVGDSALHLRLYPEHPVLAFTKFRLNSDNFIRLERKNRMFCNVDLQSLQDSCHISIMAHPQDSLRQDIRAVVERLDLTQLFAAIPGVPKMSGLLNIDANYEQDSQRFWVRGMTHVDRFVYDGTPVGNVKAVFDYDPEGTDSHHVKTRLSHDEREVGTVDGIYDGSGDGRLDADVHLLDLPLSMAAPFIPDQIVTLDGTIGGDLAVKGPLDRLSINGQLFPDGMRVNSDMYGLKLRFANEPFAIDNSRITFNRYSIYGVGDNPLTLNGWVDFADTDDIQMALSLYGRNFQLMDAPRTRKSLLFGKMFGDFFVRVNGSLNDLRVRGLVNILNNTDLTYLMADTPLSIDSRLDDIVTFVDFTEPPDLDENRAKRQFMGTDMQITLQVEDGAQFHSEFSADRQSYVDVQGGGTIIMNYTPEGVLSMQGRYTVNEGEMKYTLPVIPLKTFVLQKGSYVEFTGEPTNPILNIAASEQTRASVSDDSGASRSVLFNTGLSVTGTLEEMELLFTIDAPEDIAVQNELMSMSKEEKNKLAVAMLTTGMYLSSTNASGFSANNALNNFLQNEINNIAGKALSSTEVDVNVGMEQSARDDGTTRTDYSFKFSKRFFSNRLNVVIGGKVNADGNTPENESDAYIDNVSLEWRLDKGGTRYMRLYHEKNYDNLIEGELIENGASLVLKKKVDSLSDLLIWKKK